MSVRNQDGVKVVLGRGGPDEFWERVIAHYAEGHPQRWKLLAMFALRENAGWPLERIGVAFGHSRGHVARCLARIKADLRQRFGCAPELLDPHEPDDADAFQSVADDGEPVAEGRG